MGRPRFVPTLDMTPPVAPVPLERARKRSSSSLPARAINVTEDATAVKAEFVHNYLSTAVKDIHVYPEYQAGQYHIM